MKTSPVAAVYDCRKDEFVVAAVYDRRVENDFDKGAATKTAVIDSRYK